MFEKLKARFNERYFDGLAELEKRRQRKEARDKKKMQSLRSGTIGYGLAMHQTPVEVYHAVLEKRRRERAEKENKK